MKIKLHGLLFYTSIVSAIATTSSPLFSATPSQEGAASLDLSLVVPTAPSAMSSAMSSAVPSAMSSAVPSAMSSAVPSAAASGGASAAASAVPQEGAVAITVHAASALSAAAVAPAPGPAMGLYETLSAAGSLPLVFRDFIQETIISTEQAIRGLRDVDSNYIEGNLGRLDPEEYRKGLNQVLELVNQLQDDEFAQLVLITLASGGQHCSFAQTEAFAVLTAIGNLKLQRRSKDSN